MKNEDGYMYVDLPEPRYNLPREKPLPTPKPLTKWQKFAIEKGIKKTPKPKTTWDDILQVGIFCNIYSKFLQYYMHLIFILLYHTNLNILFKLL